MSEYEKKIRIADWQSDSNSLSEIRREVFIEEQNVPVELEWDEFDEISIHFLVTLDDRPIGCARLKPDGQIGRMAISKKFRNQGIGHELLQFVLRTAGEKSLKNVYLHAQVTAVPFYEKHGFTAAGDIFFEANIPHREMSKNIC